jgi:acyl carrier protein
MNIAARLQDRDARGRDEVFDRSSNSTTEGAQLMPTTEEVRADLAEIVNEVAGVPVNDVQLDKSFTDDLDVDSLSMVEIIYAAEEKFGVSIPDEEAKNLKTVGDAVAYIERAAA